MIWWSDIVVIVWCYSLLFSQCEQQAMTLIDSTWHTRQLLNPKLVHDFSIYLKIFLLQDSNFLLLIGSIDAMSAPLLCLNICPETLRSKKTCPTFSGEWKRWSTCDETGRGWWGFCEPCCWSRPLLVEKWRRLQDRGFLPQDCESLQFGTEAVSHSPLRPKCKW